MFSPVRQWLHAVGCSQLIEQLLDTKKFYNLCLLQEEDSFSFCSLVDTDVPLLTASQSQAKL
jgi:hypothetical protein